MVKKAKKLIKENYIWEKVEKKLLTNLEEIFKSSKIKNI